MRTSFAIPLLVCSTLAVFTWRADPIHAQVKAFPQAEGFGANATGGRGGDVYHVTSLADTNTLGTLRYGIENAPTTGRTIVFDVSGWINLTSKLGIVKEKRNITIAGQTAPGGGIGVRFNQFSVGGDSIIVRHMRFRPGKAVGRVDSVGINADAQSVIFDHVSAGMSFDENFSTAARDVTLQFSTVNYGLESHSAGSLIEQAYRLSFHHNLYAHNNTRNPKARVNETIDWINNVVYDYNNGFIAGDSDTTTFFWTANFDGNYYITGPGDTGRPMIRDGRAHNYGLYFGTNAYDNDGDTLHDGALYTGNGMNGVGLENVVTGAYTWAGTPYATPVLWKEAGPQAAYERVLREFGATPWNRDEVDRRLHDDVVNRTGALIERESDLVGISNGGFGTLAAGVAETDTDRDGMPDHWEQKHGTSPLVANNNGDYDSDGYTDLEEYLNDLAAFPATEPLQFSGTGRYAQSSRWSHQWEPSRVDEVQINADMATVDAAGQRAGRLRIGAAERRSLGTLEVTSGWLEVTDDLELGAEGFGRVTQTGGEVRVLNDGVHILRGVYALDGGRLETPLLSKSDVGIFAFTGGELSADVIDFNLVNAGGVLSPGNSPGSTHILGDLSMQNGTIKLEIAGTDPGEYDTLAVDGSILGIGRLDVELSNFYPAAGDSFQLLSFGNLEGSFQIELPDLDPSLRWNASQLLTQGRLRVTNVPEPAGAVLLLFGVVASCRRRLRRR